MVKGVTTNSRPQTGAPALPAVPAQRVSAENHARRHRAPTLGELINNAMMIIRRDQLGPSGYLVVESKGSAKHQHAVWELGPFALLDDGWFGQVHGREGSGDQLSRWLRKHERRCHEQHWTQFQWIDPAVLDVGCGAANIGLGLSPDGPTYCPGQRFGEPHPTHISLVDLFKQGLRRLALEQQQR
ncbi:MAG: hypothetical protein ACJ72E_06465 [Marmoricola sp.]